MESATGNDVEAAPLLEAIEARTGRTLNEPSGQRTNETSLQERRHINGWLAASWATEVFAIVALTCFSPLVLEASARANGVLAPDLRSPCRDKPLEPAPPETEPLRCFTPILGHYIDSASFALYVFSASVALQAVTVISLSAKLDAARSRWRTFVGASLAGSIATTGFVLLPDTSPAWLLLGVLAVIGNVGFGCSVVALNAWLPLLARPRDDPRALARLSARGIALGYFSGILGLGLSLVPVTLAHGSNLSLRFAVAGSGLWWLLSTGLAARWLPSTGEDERHSLGDGWRALGAILAEARALPRAFTYLAAWFLLSDAMSTITASAVLFGRTTLGMPPSRIILIAILTPLAGIAGSVVWPKVAGQLGLRDSLHSVIVLVLLVLLLPAYGLIGLLPVFRTPDAPPFGGLRTETELFVLAVLFGFCYGPFQADSRATFALLVPAGKPVP